MAARVAAILRARGAPPSTIDDAIQVAVERALHRSAGFDSLEGLVNWMVTVAWREAQAEWRRQARCELGEVPDEATGDDPSAVVEDRLKLSGVLKALTLLTPADQAAILLSLAEDSSRTEPLSAAEKMRRSRARHRLASIARKV